MRPRAAAKIASSEPGLVPRPGHVVELPELPTCDICKVEPAAWDTPLRGHTAWAYQCEGCNELLGANDGQTGVGIGQRLIAREVGA